MNLKNIKMTIKKLSVLVLFTLLIMACKEEKKESIDTNKETETTMDKKEVKPLGGVTKFDKLSGYYIKNTVEFDQAYKFVVVSNQEAFNNYFGIAKTMKNKVSDLDFEKFNIAGILVNPINKANTINITKFTAEGAKQIVHFTTIIGKEQTYTSGELVLFKIPKSRTSVEFNSGGEIVTVDVE
ncbi:MAG: hypothetical protein COB12_11265 [Flavobacterium sp.]|nr:MAG: hypothetical protein COB12_11265 [Flavobacterium sp.]